MYNPIYQGKIDDVMLPQYPKNKIKRTYGWDCPYQDYTSKRHFNTQRHIYLRHGIGSGEPVDHMTGETRDEKRRAANVSRNRPMNVSVYSRTSFASAHKKSWQLLRYHNVSHLSDRYALFGGSRTEGQGTRLKSSSSANCS